jgi:hypothetical protein
MLTLLSEEIEMLKLRVAAMVKRGEQGRARLLPLTVRVQQARLAAVAIASLGLAGTTAHSATAGATRGMPAQARAAADRIPATRPGTGLVLLEHVLKALAVHPASLAAKLEAFAILNTTTALFVQNELGGGSARQQRNAAYLNHALATGRYPGSPSCSHRPHQRR